jgi:hypothetical protein
MHENRLIKVDDFSIFFSNVPRLPLAIVTMTAKERSLEKTLTVTTPEPVAADSSLPKSEKSPENRK